jgi:hypothetical protein
MNSSRMSTRQNNIIKEREPLRSISSSRINRQSPLDAEEQRRKRKREEDERIRNSLRDASPDDDRVVDWMLELQQREQRRLARQLRNPQTPGMSDIVSESEDEDGETPNSPSPELRFSSRAIEGMTKVVHGSSIRKSTNPRSSSSIITGIGISQRTNFKLSEVPTEEKVRWRQLFHACQLDYIQQGPEDPVSERAEEEEDPHFMLIKRRYDMIFGVGAPTLDSRQLRAVYILFL